MLPLKHMQLHPPKHTHTASSHTIWTYLSPVKLWFWGSSAEMLQAVFLAFCSTFLRHTVSWTGSVYLSIQRINILDLILCSRSSPIKAMWFMFCQLFTQAGLSHNEISSWSVHYHPSLTSEQTFSGRSGLVVTVQDCPVKRNGCGTDWSWIKSVCRIRVNPEGSSLFSNNRFLAMTFQDPFSWP